MIDNFDGDAAVLGFVEGAGGVTVERFPGFFVDLGLQRGFERFVWVVRAQKIGVAYEEAFFVVVGVNEPAGDSLRAVAANFAGVGMEYVYAFHLNANLARLAILASLKDFDIRLAEDHE